MSEFHPFKLRPPILPEVATDRERELAEKYTRIASYQYPAYPDATTAWLCVGGQQFRLTGYHDTPEEAEWECLRLVNSLGDILAAERENLKHKGLRP